MLTAHITRYKTASGKPVVKEETEIFEIISVIRSEKYIHFSYEDGCSRIMYNSNPKEYHYYLDIEIKNSNGVVIHKFLV